MDINRSSYYKWLKRLKTSTVTAVEATRASRMALFAEYGPKYKTHGYRWLNAKIKLDIPTFTCSDPTAHKICKFLGLKSQAKHEKHKYRKPREDSKNYDNLILNQLAPMEPFKVVVSDMTAFRRKSVYYELTWYMDLFNNELISYGISTKKGDPNTYYDGLKSLITKKSEYNDFITILHTDGGSVYKSKSYNCILDSNNFIHSVSNPGKPTENGAMEAINGWTKEELLGDMMLEGGENINEAIENYMYYFNYERPQAALNYLTPMQYKEKYYLNSTSN